MEIRAAELSDKAEIIAMYERSQMATGLPNPELVPMSELGPRLYSRHAIERFVAIEAGRIVGHGLIEEPNPHHEQAWRQALNNTNDPILEMGGAFVDPEFAGHGIWTALLRHRTNVIRAGSTYPVSATWATNEHVKRTFLEHGGIEAGEQETSLGRVSLFVFQLQ